MPPRRIAFLFAALAYAGWPVRSQPDFTIGGYVVQFPVYQRLNETISLLSGTSRGQAVDATRLRIRPSISWGESSFLMLEHEISAVYTFNSLGLLSSPVFARRQLFDLSWDLATGPRWFARHFVDRLYFRTSISFLEITAGRQRIAWGSGRVWNPTDLFNPISPTSFSKVEKDGADAVQAKITLGQFSDATVVWNPQKGLPSNYGVRARTNLAGYDCAAIAGLFDSRVNLGADITGSILDAGIRCEALYSMGKDDAGSSFVRWIAGVDNQFTERLYGLLEVQFNGEGKRNRNAYEVIRLFQGEILNVSRLYGTIQASYLLHPLVTLSASWLQNWVDGSGFVGGIIQISLTDEMSGAVGGQYFRGSVSSEYWYFPTTLYARFDAYF